MAEEQFVKITHQPHGEQHPYIPLGCERSPRDPASGETVTLNLEVEAFSEVDKIWCEWTVNSHFDQHREECNRVKKEDKLEQWQIVLPPFVGGEIVLYRFLVQSGSAISQSETYSFEVDTWVETGRILSLKAEENNLSMVLSTALDNVKLKLNIVSQAGSLFVKVMSLAVGEEFKENFSSTRQFPLDDLLIDLQDEPFLLEFHRPKDGLIVKLSTQIKALVNHAGEVKQYILEFESPIDEAFYGFGERFNALDQRGNQLDNYVYGQYTSQGKRTYIPVPFFISSRGYGMWLKTSCQAYFNLAASNQSTWSVKGQALENEPFELVWFFQPKPMQIVREFAGLTGKPALPPDWTFGLWMSSNDWNSQAEVLNQLRTTKELQIPSSVLVIEAWSDEINFYIWNDALYEVNPTIEPMQLCDYRFPAEGRWPNPKAMADELHQNGLRLVLWQNPVIKLADPQEPYDDTLNKADQKIAIAQGYVVTKADGSPHRVEPHMPWFC